MSCHHLFVYGTLRRGSDTEFARLLIERGQFVGTARVCGRLYDFGRYPGARPSDQPTESIVGEIFLLLKAPGAVIAALDDYEGLEFQRAMVSATGRYRIYQCWIYWYVGDDPGRLIPSGDWLQR